MSSRLNGTQKTKNLLGTTRRKRKDEQEEANDLSSEVVNDLEIAHKYACVSSCFSALDLGKTASSTGDFRFAEEENVSTSVITPRIVDYSSSSSEEGEEGPYSVGESIGSSDSSEYESETEWTEASAQVDPNEIIDDDDQIDGGSSRNRNDRKGRQHSKANCGNKSYYYHHYLNQIDASQLQLGEQQQVQFLPKKDDVIELVGNIKSHIIGERVIVVESLSYGSRNKPLGEGNILLLSKNDLVDEDITDSNTGRDGFFPLGEICEVFGPVSRPLYTVQLPSPVCNTNPNDENDTTIQQNVEKNTLNEDPIFTPNSHDDSIKGQSATKNVQEREEDPWSETGVHTLKLCQRRQNNLIPVYFERKRAVWVDTHEVIEQSGRGCDVNEEDEKETVEFSDDEAERQYYASIKQRTQKPQQKQQSLPQTNIANRNSRETKPQFMHNTSFNTNQGRHTTRTNFHSNPHTGSLGILPFQHQHATTFMASFPYSNMIPHPQLYTHYLHATNEMNPPRLITHPNDSPNVSTPNPSDVTPVTSATRKDHEADTVYYHY